MKEQQFIKNTNKVLLVMAPAWGVDMPPLSLAVLSAVLKSKDFTVQALDLNALYYNQVSSSQKKLWKLENIRSWVEKESFSEIVCDFDNLIEGSVKTIIESNYSYIGFSVNRSNIFFSAEIARRLKKKNPKIKIIFGGPSCLMLDAKRYLPTELYYLGTDDAFLENGIVDVFVQGEGENVFTEVLESLDKKKLNSVKGISFFDGDKYVYTGRQKKNLSLDKIPVPDFSVFDLSLYEENKLPVFFSRGCIGNCSFCNDTVEGGRYRHKSPEKILEEFMFYKENFNVDFFHCCDLLLNGDLKKLETLCDLLIEKDLNVVWTGQAIARSNMTEDLYRKMKQAGCASLVLGVETFSDRVLKLMNKNVTLADIKKNLRQMSAAGMESVINLMVGFPGEEDSDIALTQKELVLNASYIKCVSSLSLFMLTENSKIWQDPKKYDVIPSPSGDKAMWTDSKGSTYAVRKDRGISIMKTLQEANIELLSTTFYDEYIEEQKKKERALRQSDITLVLCPAWGVMMPPIGLAFLSENLRKNGVEVKVIDYNIELYNKTTSHQKHFWNFNSFDHWVVPESFNEIKKAFLGSIEKLVDDIIEGGSAIVGFSVFSPNRLYSIEVMRLLREKAPHIKIIVGGRGCVTEGDRDVFIPENLVDLFVLSEAEDAMTFIVNSLKEGKVISDIEGVCVVNGRNVYNSRPPVLISELPFPRYEDFNLSDYSEKILPLLFSRGCVGACAFCSDYLGMGKFRVRDEEEMFSEIHYHYYNNKIDHFWFNDPAVNGNKQHLDKLCDLIIDSGISIKWCALAIPKKDLDFDLMQKMKKAGCYSLNLGLETGSDNILKKMNKFLFSVNEAEKVLKDAKAADLPTRINFIVGFPGETEDDFSQTLDFLERNRDNIHRVNNINACIVLGDSVLYKNHQKYGIILPEENSDRNWTDIEGNTLEIRTKRVELLKNKLDELNILYEISNTEEREADIGMLNKTDYDKDILLVLCPPWGVDMAPLGLACLNTYIKKKGFSSKAIDFNIDIYRKLDSKKRELWRMENIRCWQEDDFFYPLLDDLKEHVQFCVDTIMAENSRIVGFSVNQSNMRFSIEIAKKIKEIDSSKIIIFGGPETYWDAKDEDFPAGIYNHITNKIMIYPGLIDIFVKGEGEITLTEIITAVKKNASLENIDGCTCFIKGKYAPYERRELIPVLDELPYPEFEDFNLSDYLELKIPMMMSRGCISKCNFCNDHIMSGRFRTRSAENIFAEMKFHIEQKGIGYIHFCDLLINGNLKELEKLCDLIIESPYEFGWSGQAFTRDDMSVELLRKLKQAGCSALVLGVESCSQKVLECMNKKYTPDKIKNVLAKAKQAGLDTVINLIVGFPGETEKEFYETLDFISENRSLIDKISSAQTLHLTTGSLIDTDPDRFGIIRPKEESWFRWYTEEGNTYDIRKNRLKSLYRFLKAQDLTVYSINLYEDNIEKQKNILKGTEEECREVIQTDSPFSEEAVRAEELIFPKADIMLLNPPPWGVNNPPIGLAYLDSYLRKHGISTHVFDFNVYLYLALGEKYFNFWHVENKSFWNSAKGMEVICSISKNIIDKVVESICKSGTEIIGFSVVDPKEKMTISLIEKICKIKPEIKIILGGAAVTTESGRQIFLDNVADNITAFVIGEGEETLLELVTAIKNKRDTVNLKGTVTCDNGKWVYNKRKNIQPLDSIPFPDYQTFNLDAYGRHSLLLEWSRGCAGKCSFCKNHTLVGGYRIHSAKHIADELRYNVEVNKINHFTVCDSVLNGNLKILEEVCDYIIDSGLEIELSGQVAPTDKMTEELFKKLHKAGFKSMQFGLESGSDKVLGLMGKKYTISEVKHCLKLAHNAGIETEVFIIIGFPGEAEADFMLTYDFVRDNRSYIDTIKSINTLHLISGTDVYENFSKYEIMLPEDNWHYLWQSVDGKNTYDVRKKRGEVLLKLAYDLGVKVKETNLSEGKEQILEKEGVSDIMQDVDNLKSLTLDDNKHQPISDVYRKELSEVEQELNNIKNSRSFKIARKMVRIKNAGFMFFRKSYRLPFLLFLLLFSLFMESFLYLRKKITGSVIFPGG